MKRSFGTCPIIDVAILLLLTLSCGCSSQTRTYKAGGRVLQADGTPVANARIEARSVEHPYIARGAIDEKGNFQLTTFRQLDGAVAGRHQVIIVAAFTATVADMKAHSSHVREVRTINPKFAKYDTSGLEIQIHSGKDNRRLEIVLD